MIEPGNTVALNFWANGSGFVLTFGLIGVAKVRPCKFESKCPNANCTSEHDGADRTAVVVAGKFRKLCSMSSSPSGCPNGNNCWYSHEVQGVGCMHSGLQATHSKSPYCFYKHNNKGVIVSAETIIEVPVQVKERQKPEKTEATIQIATPIEGKSDSTAPETGDDMLPKQ